MNIMSFNTSQENDLLLQSDVLAVFKDSEKQGDVIEQGMPLDEIAEITSNYFIAAVRMQFEEAKRKFEGTPSPPKSLQPRRKKRKKK